MSNEMKEKPPIQGRKRFYRIAAVVLVLLLAAGIWGAYAVWHGIIQLNHPSRNRYPIRGVDISHYQGNIDWLTLAGQGIDFAYIKATEGSSHVDGKFLENWENAGQTGLWVGAYHFFSFDSPAEGQLKNFTKTVPARPGMLPPVVDFEFYGDKKVNPPDAEEAAAQLSAMLEGLEAYYGMRPVVYATEDTWEMYLKGRFEEYPLWIRDVVSRPDTGEKDWLFWQYTNREKLKGYDGAEEFIDMNVFAGSEKEWELWLESAGVK